MRYIEHLVETDRLLLSWQAQDSEQSTRYVVGEVVRNGNDVALNYFKKSDDYKDACTHGFSGYPAFQTKLDGPHNNQVLEAFYRRLPPKNRSDFARFLEIRGINSESNISAFTLLGYTGAKLPDDGFELVHPFENLEAQFELIIEIAGFRHKSEVPVDGLNEGDRVRFEFEPENKFDNLAIAITKNGLKLGYVDRGRVSLFNKYLKTGANISGEIIRKNGTKERPLIYVLTTIIPNKVN